MKKKLIAVAVAGALGVPVVAAAQTSTVTISGRAYVEYGYTNTGSNATGTQNRVNSDALQTGGSNIAIKGEESLGGGLSAWYQCESTADPRGQGDNSFCSRNSALGFKGGFGNVFLGNWDTPFKRARIQTGSGDTGFFGTSGPLTGHSTSTLDGASPSLFARRQNNSINYETPKFGGFGIQASTSTTNNATARTSSAPNDKPRLVSVAGTYDNGPLKVTAAYERHNDFYSSATWAGDESGYLFGASYTFANKLTLGGMYTRQKWDDTATTSGKVSAWQIGIDWMFSGPHGIRAAYTAAGDVKGNSAAVALRPAASADTAVKMYQARYVYAFSKRTEMTVGFNHVKNDRLAGYNINGIGNTGGTGANNGFGGKHTAYAIGIDHRF